MGRWGGGGGGGGHQSESLVLAMAFSNFHIVKLCYLPEDLCPKLNESTTEAYHMRRSDLGFIHTLLHLCYSLSSLLHVKVLWPIISCIGS